MGSLLVAPSAGRKKARKMKTPIRVKYLDWEGAEARGRGTPGYDRFYKMMAGEMPPTKADLADYFVDMGAVRFPHCFNMVMAAKDEAICEAIWVALQNGVGAGVEATLGRRARSMCVGDVICIGGRVWAAANCGFVRVR